MAVEHLPVLLSHGATADRPTAGQDIVGKIYRDTERAITWQCVPDGSGGYSWSCVDASTALEDIRVDVRATGNVNIASAPATIDGVSYTTALCDQQSTGSQDGCYRYVATGSALVRMAEMPTGMSAAALIVRVMKGNTQADRRYICTNDEGSDVVGTDGLTFTTPTIATEASHTHAITSPTGAPSGEAAVGDGTHTHAITSPTGAPSGEAAVGDGTHTHAGGACTGTSDATSTNNMGYQTFTAPAASGVAAHAQFFDDAGAIVAGFTDPPIPRNMVFTFGAQWVASPGGDLTYAGTDQDDAAFSVTVASNPGGTTTCQVITKTSTSITYTAGPGGGTHTVDMATGKKLGITDSAIAAAIGLETVDGVIESATWDIALHQRGVTMFTDPNGARNFAILFPKPATTHTHGVGSYTSPTSGTPSATVNVGATGHTHSVTSPTAGPSATVNVGATGHTHSITSPTAGPSATVNVGATGHTHAITSPTGAGSAHTHTIAG